MKLLKRVETSLLKEIDHVTEEMSIIDPSSDEYSTMAENLEKLTEAQRKLETAKVNPDTILVVVGSLAEVLLILNYEKIGYISSKALNFVIKGRVK